MNPEEFKNQHPTLNKSVFNTKKFKKSVKSTFDHAINMSRLRITQKDKEFDGISKSIIKILDDILASDDTFSKGNIYFVLTVMSNHLDFLKEKNDRISKSGEISKETLLNIQEELMLQHESIKESLLENLKAPCTYDNLAEQLGIAVDTDTKETVDGEQKS